MAHLLAPALAQEHFVVRGGRRLQGEVRVQGAKNSALKLLAATLLAEGVHRIGNVPQIADVPVMGEILAGLGATVAIEGSVVTIDMPRPHWQAPEDAVKRIRASISTLGPLVGRTGRARLALPGGDQIGARAIDLHLRGLVAMGAEVEVEGAVVDVRAPRLHGADITLDFPSVGATENLVMAAVLAAGTTTIDAAAREPEIQDLCRHLVAMGADIEGIGSATLTIHGVDRLTAVAFDTMPDRIEAGTHLVAAALTRGDVTLTHVAPEDLRLPLRKLEQAGVAMEVGEDTIRVTGADLRPVEVVTLPYPGFPTDLQPQMMVLLSQANGTSMCTENVFESRFAFVDELCRMGADIVLDGHHALIRGASPLHGAVLNGLDVRAGAAGVLAGLVATGETVVRDVHHVDRGYADLVTTLQGLGADVERRPAN